jgi:hypothetical protein
VESALEVRYSGVVVGRGAPVRDRDGGSAFVVLAEPLPVGTRITLRGEAGEEQARVTEVIESANPDVAGMRISFGAADAGRKAAPVPKPQAQEPPVERAPADEPPPAPKKPAVEEAPPRATQKPPVVEEPPERETPPVVETATAPPATQASPLAEAAPSEVATSDSTASSAHAQGQPPGQSPDGFGGSGKRRRRRR